VAPSFPALETEVREIKGKSIFVTLMPRVTWHEGGHYQGPMLLNFEREERERREKEKREREEREREVKEKSERKKERCPKLLDFERQPVMSTFSGNINLFWTAT
jgi:hypothetical protein